MRIIDIQKLVHLFYDTKTYEHVCRVAKYVEEMSIIPLKFQEEAIKVAWLHDILEDTTFNIEQLPPTEERVKKAVLLLTKAKEIPYDIYCSLIRQYTDKDYGKIAYYVKLADMKDHLSQKKTLTPKLKKKYLEGLAELL